jgi:hypothetical protein
MAIRSKVDTVDAVMYIAKIKTLILRREERVRIVYVPGPMKLLWISSASHGGIIRLKIKQKTAHQPKYSVEKAREW